MVNAYCLAFFKLLLASPIFFNLPGQDQPEFSTGYHEKPKVTAKTAMVVSANPYATKTGIDILKKGGNAIDAAIAMQMVLNVVEPQSSGLGGGAFLLYYDKNQNKVFAFDGREKAPEHVNENLFLDYENKPIDALDAIVGGTSVGVPGLLKMLEIAHQEYGTQPWESLFQPGIELAEKGFPISDRLHELISTTPRLNTFAETRAFFFENGKPKDKGALLKNLKLAQTFKTIAKEGSNPFYYGEIAQSIVNVVQNAPLHPGALSLEDLASYKSIKRKPIKTPFFDYTIYGFPPPSSGGIAVAQILMMLQNTELKKYDLGSLNFVNLFCNASRLAFADRDYYIADPDFFPVPVDKLLDPKYLKKRSHRILENRALPTATPGLFTLRVCCNLFGSPPLELSSTSQICIVDGFGNAISMTTSVENAFGSTLMVDGFFLNNQLTDFSFIPQKEGKKAANRVEGKKRPISSMSPTFVFKNGALVLTLGSAGGARIINYVAQALVGTLAFDNDIQKSISFPHYTAVSNTIDLEKNTFLEEYKIPIELLGNAVNIEELTSGSAGIQIDNDTLISGVDPRREGAAMGY